MVSGERLEAKVLRQLKRALQPVLKQPVIEYAEGEGVVVQAHMPDPLPAVFDRERIIAYAFFRACSVCKIAHTHCDEYALSCSHLPIDFYAFVVWGRGLVPFCAKPANFRPSYFCQSPRFLRSFAVSPFPIPTTACWQAATVQALRGCRESEVERCHKIEAQGHKCQWPVKNRAVKMQVQPTPSSSSFRGSETEREGTHTHLLLRNARDAISSFLK